MTRCPHCGADNTAGTKFCGECGTRLATRCSSCGAVSPATNKFCGECGARLTTQASELTQPPAAYTPKHLAEKILTSKAALEGERKQVTILFADLKGSMELLADRDPEDARKLLDSVLERMMEAVHRFEGTVNQVMGDGIMALFGAPLAHEDHAVRACYAALRMQETVTRYAEGVRRQQGVAIRIRVGLNSGEVVVRAIGSDLRMDYTAVGQTTHLAARMEQLADPGSILLTPETLALADGFVQVSSLGPMAVRGIPAPLEVYELTGVSAVRSRLQAAATRGLSRFVGRDAEIEQLRRALEQSRQGRGQVAAIVGEPGVGKSRLVFELTHSHRVEGWLVLEASSVSYGKATSYLPVIDLLKGYFRIGDHDAHRDIREKVTGRLLTLDRALEPTVSAVLALLDVPVDDPHWQALDPPQRRQRTLDAIKHVLLREVRNQPVLVIFEDLHWIDSETQVLLDSMVESLPTARLLLLVTYRPEYRHAWGSKTFYTQLRLDTLPRETAESLLDTLLGPNPSLGPLKRLLAVKTGGNPLFLEESVRTLVETRALLGERGAYQLAQSVEAIQVPATVQAILAARIDRLPPAEKRLLETAAVIGKDVPFHLLQAIADQSDEALRRGLGQLRTSEFLYETSLFPDLEYTFKHALTHEVAYGSLLQEHRRTLHARIVDAIGRLHPDRLTEQIERLAHHALRAEQWAKAFTYLREAGAKAIGRSAYREAIAFWEEALRVFSRLPESPETIEQAIDIRFELRHALTQIEGYRSVLDNLREAERMATALGDRRRLGWVHDYLSNYHYNVGDIEVAVQTATSARAIGSDLGDFALTVAASFHLGCAYWRRGAYREAATVLSRNLDMLSGRSEPERLGLAVPPSLLVRVWLSMSLAELGQFPESVRQAEQAVRIARETGRDLDAAYAYPALGVANLRQGHLARAIAPLESWLPRCRAAFPALVHEFGGPLGCAYALSTRIAEALPLLEEAINSATAAREIGSYSIMTTHLGEGYLLADRVEDARMAGLRALELSREHQQRGDEAWALHLLGAAAQHQNVDTAISKAHYHAATSLATELGMRPLVAHCHLGLGTLCQRIGHHTRAQDHLATAAAMYREMDMPFWLTKTEVAMQAAAT